jgi:hypothetical protein
MKSDSSNPQKLAAELSRVLLETAERLSRGDPCNLTELAATVSTAQQAWAAVSGDLSSEILDPVAWQARAARDRQRQIALEAIAWVQSLSHVGDADFQPLHSLAQRSREAISQLDLGGEPTAIAAPFIQLHELVTQLNGFPEDKVEELRSAVSAAFGAPLAIAAIRGNLRHSEPLPESAPSIEAEDASPAHTNDVIIQSAIELEVPTAPVPKPVIAEAITGVEILKVVASKPDPGLQPPSESEKSPDEADLLAPDPDAAAWRALARGRASLAFHIARSQTANDADGGFPAELGALIALTPACDGSGRIDDAIREQCSHLWQRLTKPSLSDPAFLPGFLAAVRVALLARGASADAVLYPAREALSGEKVLGAIASAATEIVIRDQVVTPAVLAGVVERARWEDELGAIKERATEWLRAQESAQLKFARATEVWHKWVLPSADIGAMVKVVAEDRRAERHLATDAIDRLSSGFDRLLMAMDRKLHGHTADRNPIEARPSTRCGTALDKHVRWCANGVPCSIIHREKSARQGGGLEKCAVWRWSTVRKRNRRSAS